MQIQVVLELKVMKKRMILMIWRTSLTLEATLTTSLRPCTLPALMLAVVPKLQRRPHHQSWILHLFLQISRSWPMVKRWNFDIAIWFLFFVKNDYQLWFMRLVLIFFFKGVGISPDKHALIVPPFMSRGKRVHPMPISDSPMSCKLVEIFLVFFFSLFPLNDAYCCSD